MGIASNKRKDFFSWANIHKRNLKEATLCLEKGVSRKIKNRKIDRKGVEKRGSFALRTVEDAVAVRQYAKNGKKAIVIGGGLLGLEFAACLRKLGQQVEVVEIRPRLLSMQLDQDGSTILEDDLRELGVNTALAVKTTEILSKEAVAGVAFDDGKKSRASWFSSRPAWKRAR